MFLASARLDCFALLFCSIADHIMSTLQLFFGSVAEKVVFSFHVGFIFKKLTMKPTDTPSMAKDFIFQEKNENKVVCVLDIQPEKVTK